MKGLAPRFRPREAFVSAETYRLLPFRFGRFGDGRYVVTNDVGEYVILSRDELVAFTARRLSRESPVYRALEGRHFLFDEHSDVAIDLLALKVRSRAESIAELTGLHIFVVTLRCDHSCHYCQVSRQTEDRGAFDMSRAHAELALGLVFASPAPVLKIELQGGEPLLAFDLVRFIVERAEELARERNRRVEFVIASSLSRLDDEILTYCSAHEIVLSTSLDGPADLHDAHRPLRGRSSHAAAVEGIQRARASLGRGSVSALMTTTPASLSRVADIIDEYARLGFDSVFLRGLSPYGFAMRTNLARRYSVADWLTFYRTGLDHILALNRAGRRFREEYATIVLQKMFGARGTGYVDLRSPSGIGIGALVYNYDGSIHASDESRMLAEMGDQTFRLGHVETSSYEDVLGSDALLAPLEDSLLESAPMCADCPYLPYCGADPTFHHATQGDALGHKAFSAFCEKQMGIVEYLLRLLEEDADARRTLLGWVRAC